MKASNLRPTGNLRPATGYGLMVYRAGDLDLCGFLDGSPVLVPTAIERDGDRRRIRFSEGSRQLRSMGDVFCGDIETAALVRQALNEKFERDRDLANAFRITGTRISVRGKYTFLTINTGSIQSGEEDLIKFTLEAPSFDIQQEGHRDFSALLDAVGLASIEDSQELRGLTATTEMRNGNRVFKRWKPE